MANEEQLAILKQGVRVWNEWRDENAGLRIDLSDADLRGFSLYGASLNEANLVRAKLIQAKLIQANLPTASLVSANLTGASLGGAFLYQADLRSADLTGADLLEANLSGANLMRANLRNADLRSADLTSADLTSADLRNAIIGATDFAKTDLSQTIGLEKVGHSAPSTIGTDTLQRSQGKIPDVFLRGCGLSDWEIEAAKLYNPALSNHEINDVQYRMYDLRATQALQISPLFVSYSHADSAFIDKIGKSLTEKGIRYWRDIHEMKAGRMETQVDRAIRQNPTVLLVLSEKSLASDWVQHEVRMARGLEKELNRDVLCPVALDKSWKDSQWPKRIMEQLMEYNILDFSDWQDESRFDGMFRRLIDGLELFYKGESDGE